MRDAENPSESKVPEPWQPRFGLAGLMLVMLIFCVMSAAGYYLVRAIRSGASFGAISIVLAMAAPAVLLVSISVSRQVLAWIGRHGRRR